jgi:Zn-finger nucleic acid-binding protein
MTRVEEDGLRLATCPDCFGVWIAGTALLRRLRMDVDNNVDTLGGGSLENLIELVGESDAKVPLRCPDCAKPMAKTKLHPLIPVTIDRCGICKGVWLDAGEFRLLRTLHKELMTSDDPELQRKLEKIAGVRLQEDAWADKRKQMQVDLDHLRSHGSFGFGDLPSIF